MVPHQLCMTVTKIFNWTETAYKKNFILSFYSPQTNQFIMEKPVQGVLSANTLHLNSLLKIAYTSDEQQVVLKLKADEIIIGQFTINLSTLSQKKIQYFPFGERDKVLQINLTSDQQIKSIMNIKDKEDPHDKFIRDRQNFLQGVLVTHQTLKRNYSQKITTLLTHCKQSTLYDPIKHKYQNQKKIDIPTDNILEKQKQFQERRLNKSRSQQAFNYINHNSYHAIIENEGKTSNIKNKLILNTLNIVSQKQKIQKYQFTNIRKNSQTNQVKQSDRENRKNYYKNDRQTDHYYLSKYRLK